MKIARGMMFLLMASLPLLGCGKSGDGGRSLQDLLVERTSEATLAWQIDEDGQTRVRVHGASCQPLQDVEGTLRYANTTTTDEKEVKLEPDGESLVAQGPALDPELTEIHYNIVAGGNPIKGTLHVPASGTKALVQGAKAGEPKTEQEKGPHGGVVENVGDDKYEVVADTTTGVVRVYPLAGKKVQQVRLVRGAETSKTVTLKPVKDYYAGVVPMEGSPGKLTLVVKDDAGKVRVHLIGLRRGRAIHVGQGAPRARFWAKRDWVEEHLELDGDPSEKGKKGKVTICHIPPGNPGNQHTIRVGASAVAAHLAHGDHEGACTESKHSKAKETGKGKDKEKEKEHGNGKEKEKGHGKGKGKGKGH